MSFQVLRVQDPGSLLPARAVSVRFAVWHLRNQFELALCGDLSMRAAATGLNRRIRLLASALDRIASERLPLTCFRASILSVHSSQVAERNSSFENPKSRMPSHRR